MFASPASLTMISSFSMLDVDRVVVLAEEDLYLLVSILGTSARSG